MDMDRRLRSRDRRRACTFTQVAGERNRAEALRLRRVHGAEGYGVYMMIKERMAEADDGRLRLDELDVLAYELGVEAALVSDVVRGFGLFAVDEAEGVFFSTEMEEERLRRLNVSRKRAEAGRRGMASRWGNVALGDEAIGAEASGDVEIAENEGGKQLDNNCLTKKEREKEKEMLSPAPLSKEKEKEKESSGNDARARACVREGSDLGGSDGRLVQSRGGRPRAREGVVADVAYEARLMAKDDRWTRVVSGHWGLTEDGLRKRLDEWTLSCEMNGRYCHRDMVDAKTHFNSWMRIQVDKDFMKLKTNNYGRKIGTQQQGGASPFGSTEREDKYKHRRGVAATAQAWEYTLDF